MQEWDLVNWLATANYAVIEWMNARYWPILWGMFFTGALLGMTPLRLHHEHGFAQACFIVVRKLMLWVGFLLACLPFVVLYIYDMTASPALPGTTHAVQSWFWALFIEQGFGVLPATLLGWFGRILFHRYIEPLWSAVLKRFRHQQTNDRASDIRAEFGKFEAREFSPEKFYAADKILIGLDADNRPVHVPVETWRETNTQLIGPTRYGKGVIIGCLIDQAARLGDACIYIDPKKDRFAPHIMYAAAKRAGKPFYYVALHDDDVGSWAPFAGGAERDGLARIETAFGLQETGDPGTDYYKTQEKQLLAKCFRESRSIPALLQRLRDTDANKLKAQLERWSHIKSLCPKGKGFSLEKAMKEGALVYVQGGLMDDIVKTATKVFIIEVIQEAMRLNAERKDHLTLIVDEVRFLVSKQLADALATVVGFRVNIVTAYQSTKDIEQPDDTTLNGRSLAQSINVNSQIKAVYGGADFDTAEWAANLSGVVQKEVTKFEGTEIRASGGEIWNQRRMIGAQEENLINTNMVLSLPPRVCVFIQPRHMATIAFTSFIKVTDPDALPAWLEQKAKPGTDTPESEDAVVGISHEKTCLPEAADKALPPAAIELEHLSEAAVKMAACFEETPVEEQSATSEQTAGDEQPISHEKEQGKPTRRQKNKPVRAKRQPAGKAANIGVTPRALALIATLDQQREQSLVEETGRATHPEPDTAGPNAEQEIRFNWAKLDVKSDREMLATLDDPEEEE